MRRFSCLFLLLSGMLIFCSLIGRAQSLYPVSTDEKISRSSLIVEGKVVGKKSYWNSSHTMIFTSNQVEVYKVFKGSTEKNVIEVITVGGGVGNYYIHASHLLHLDTNDVGVFFCKSEPAGRFKVYSSSQGFIKYNLRSKKAFAPFVQYNDIEKNLYTELNNKIGQRVQIKNPNFNVERISRDLNIRSNSMLAPTISGFSPATVHAGALLDPANNVLTINGSDFGPASGSAAVEFPHSDDPSTEFVVAYNSSLIISWSNTQIRLRVPSQAGTGVFRVRDSNGAVASSSSELNVLFSILNSEDLGAPYHIKQYNLGNVNGSGGYSIKYSTNTANNGVNINTSPAKATFQRALNTWKESVGANFIEAGTSMLQLVDTDDGENLVMFDNGGTGDNVDPLDAGVLATCFSGLEICTNNSTNEALKSGFDIVIRNQGYSVGTTPFTFGPCPPFSLSSNAVDLESVLLHELGHALNLGHIVDKSEGSGAGTTNPAKVMYYAVSMNQRRISIDYSAKVGAEYQVNTPTDGRTYGSCSTPNPSSPAMVPLAVNLEPKDECPVNFPTRITANDTTVHFDLARSTSNKFVDPGYTEMTLNNSPTNITNTAYYALRTNSSGGNLSMRVSNYTTLPEDIAACPAGSTGIDVSGVKLSIYKTSQCPDGGSYPAPVVYNVFDGNTTLPEITGLDGNSNYLLVVDGLQNTKAVFDLTFSGTAIYSRVTRLEGDIFDTYNQLQWTTDTLFDVQSMILERSGNGTDYEELMNVVGEDQKNGEYRDDEPFPGDNYYRMAIHNTDGSTDYTDVLLLRRSQTVSVKILNNLENRSELLLEVDNNEPQTLGFVLQNSLGQVVLRRQMTVAAGTQRVRLPVEILQRGIYFLSVFNGKNKRVETVTVSKLR